MNLLFQISFVKMHYKCVCTSSAQRGDDESEADTQLQQIIMISTFNLSNF